MFPKRNFGSGSVMVWGAFCSTIMLKLAFPSFKINSEEYIHVLENKWFPFLEDNKQWTFQQDNAVIHTIRETKNWLSNHNIPLLSVDSEFSWSELYGKLKRYHCEKDLCRKQTLWKREETKKFHQQILMKYRRKLLKKWIMSTEQRLFQVAERKDVSQILSI